MSKRTASRQAAKPRTFASAIIAMLSGNMLATMLMGIAVIGLPKLISIELFGHWQVYVLWVTYMGYLTFGLAEGFFVRFSGKGIDDIPHKVVSFQLLLTFALVGVVTLGIFLAVYFISDDPTLHMVVGFASLTTFFYVPRVYLTYVFQSLNMMWPFARAIVMERTIFVVSAFVIAGTADPQLWQLLTADVVGRFTGLVYMLSLKYRKLGGIREGISADCNETKLTFTAGIALNLSALSAVLLTAAPRFAVQSNFSIVVFAEVAFAFTFVAMFQTVASALSTATLPNLRNAGEANYSRLYNKSSDLLAVVTSQTYLLIFPAIWFVSVWLPEREMLPTLILLMFSFVVFETRSRVISTPFLQAIREERFLMYVNVGSLAIGVGLVLLAVKLKLPVEYLVIILPFSVLIRSLALWAKAQGIFGRRRRADFISDVISFGILVTAGMGVTELSWPLLVILAWLVASAGNVLPILVEKWFRKPRAAVATKRDSAKNEER